ncbi:T9SS type B sorting domain-containing protein [Flavobacterium granuli]|uniref:Gliding motility-associated-like protein n=1 Tax=Flavobacterium granuli TaxID=280093 RepID=A0ABU1RZC1_9FLAO|nr:T9SS type B sorting domain-containing protein [Flavobacterium granuli]MDR6844094.1 gliding motility-associated-like protein [Flavobacterium granuli]
MKIKPHINILLLFAFSIYNFGHANSIPNPPKKGVTASLTKTHSLADNAPVLTATGNQVYCPLTNVNIVTSISISDPDTVETLIDAIYIQISSGYVIGKDKLSLNTTTTPHPKVIADWNQNEGKLTLKGTGAPMSYADFENAIRDVQFNNSSTTPNGTRNFSISIGQANYLPRNGHYYEYVPFTGISWTSARDAAEIRTYYGLKGYLATLTAADEAQLAGEQAPGAGWIGGSDAETEGVWKWVTGPEAGTVFWNGLSNGSTPNFAFWNNNEPNQAGVENYAHITKPGVGIPGSWNDLQVAGNPSGDYQSKGYIVEYGAPGDPALQLSAFTTLTIASISSTTPASRCDPGTVTLQATATSGTINWYNELTDGNHIGTGSSLTIPFLSTNTTYYAETTTTNCASGRVAIEAKINIIPTIINTNSPATNCGPGLFTLTATTSSVGTVNWYSQVGGSAIGSGLSYITTHISANTTYYAEATNNGCTNSIKVPVDIRVYPLPVVINETVKKCSSSTITLDAAIPNISYLWSTNETTQTIDVSTTGIYTVDVTSQAPESCTNRKTITVSEDNKPEIKNVAVNEATVAIELVKSEDYFEFSIDGINYQNSNVFNNAPSGLQSAYVRDINKCSTDNEPFIVIIVPKFFTPNNDSFNDIWEVKGLAEYPLGEVTLFDRYGKLITRLNHSNRSWDGTVNKNPLPASDYWYILKLDPNSPELKGHFSLKR